MDIKLKPCPFCGGKAVFQTRSTFHNNLYGPGYVFRIKCSKCGISPEKNEYMTSMYFDEDGKVGFRVDHREEAAKEWNERYVESEYKEDNK